MNLFEDKLLLRLRWANINSLYNFVFWMGKSLRSILLTFNIMKFMPAMLFTPLKNPHRKSAATTCFFSFKCECRRTTDRQREVCKSVSAVVGTWTRYYMYSKEKSLFRINSIQFSEQLITQLYFTQFGWALLGGFSLPTHIACIRCVFLCALPLSSSSLVCYFVFCTHTQHKKKGMERIYLYIPP